jgi:hypothetical protein
VPEEDLRAWLAGRIPEGWFAGPPEVEADDDEIVIIGRLDDGAQAAGNGGAPGETSPSVRAARVQRFRRETRDRRMAIADEAQHRFGRRISWGVSMGGERTLFTTLSLPVMTRLRQPERQVLDTLVQAGVARSRSEALAWCVRLVGRHEAEWINELREALVRVSELRQRGPS